MAIVFLIEGSIMVVLYEQAQTWTPVQQTLFDATLLSLGLAPFLWWFIVGPIRRVALDERARADTVVARAAEGILTFTPDLVIESINTAGAAIFGEPREGLVGRRLDTFVPAVGEALGGRAVIELPGKRADGAPLALELGVSEMREGRVYIALVRDVSVRRQAEDALLRAKASVEAADRAKARFLATMSHELRTPLNGVLGPVQILQDSRLTGEQRELVAMIQTSGEQLLALVEQVLEFARLEGACQAASDEVFDPRALVREVASLTRSKAEAKGLEALCAVDASLPARAVGDPSALRRVLLALTDNAVKFTPLGHVTISARAERGGEYLRFEIADSGVGISADFAASIYSPFTMADDSTTRAVGGIGLGLSLSRELVRRMGGELGVTSEEGRGSCFSVTIPAGGPSDPLRAPGSGLRAPDGGPSR